MKKFLKQAITNVKLGIIMTIKSSWYAILAAVFGLLIGFIFGETAGVLVFFGILGIVILYIFFRQIYWWFTGKRDYENKGFPKLWKKLFK